MAENPIVVRTLEPAPPGAVTPAPFQTAGLTGRFARGIGVLLNVDFSDLDSYLGPAETGKVGRLAVESFIANLDNRSGSLWVKEYVASNAVQASRNLVDSLAPTPADTITVKAAWRGNADKSAGGNRYGVSLERGYRFTTTATAAAIITATELQCASVVNFEIGDVIKVASVGNHYYKITGKDEDANTITLAAGLSEAVSVDDTIQPLGFKITTHVKNINGISSEAPVPQNGRWLSMEPENVKYYIENKFTDHKYLVLVDADSASTLEASWPAEIPYDSPLFLENGADGTAPNDDDWRAELNAFDAQPLNLLAHSETNTLQANREGELYCKGRTIDNPKWMANVPQLTTIEDYVQYGNQLQRSNAVFAKAVGSIAYWKDPAGNRRLIPVNAAAMGADIRAKADFGIQRAAAGPQVPLLGFLPWDTPADNPDNAYLNAAMERIRNAGINLVQNVGGLSEIRYDRTLSTNPAWRNSNAQDLTENIKKTMQAFLAPYAGQPATLQSLILITDELGDYMSELWSQGAFAQWPKEGGGLSAEKDAYQVAPASSVNTAATIQAGQYNLRVWFVPVGVIERILVEVGTTNPSDVRS